MELHNDYRGKTRDGKWHYGQYIYATQSMGTNRPYHKDWIVCGFASNGGWLTPLSRYAVVRNTLGKYTGLVDMNGQKIYEGDFVHLYRNSSNSQTTPLSYIAIIMFKDGCFCAIDLTPHNYGIIPLVFTDDLHCQIIGNIIDDPQLIKQMERAKDENIIRSVR